ncbi:MAG TPA: hypothetical protein VGP25_19730 [Gemmatimonadaceae bacterium]|jgi:hypothetical protein|nr:hypothetical protein [Gemmatimonadaceae bacterium]
MKRSHSALVLLLLLGACSRNKPKTFSGPARANGLECALRIATDSGFAPERGGLSQGFIWLQHNRPNTIGEKTKEAAARIATLGQAGVDRSTADRLYIVGADRQLRITASSLDEKGKEGSPTDDGERISNFILRSCAP